MFYAINFTCRVAAAPVLFITAYSNFGGGTRESCLGAIFSILVPILENAKDEYNALYVANEPTNTTHQLQHSNMENTVVVSCSLKFRNFEDLKKFLDKWNFKK